MTTVTEAAVAVDGQQIARIGPGLLVLLGVAVGDTRALVPRMVAKLHGLRVLPEQRSVAEAGAPVLLVSQFTLYGDTAKGRRPSYTQAMPALDARPLVEGVVGGLRVAGSEVVTGIFGAHMLVSSVNDGPRTHLVEIDPPPANRHS